MNTEAERAESVELARAGPAALALPEIDVDAIVQLTHQIAQLRDRVMAQGVHYGKIPGTDRCTLLQPGADKLILAFGLRPSYRIERQEFCDPPGFGYQVRCELSTRDGRAVGEGFGSCNSLERKYRYRTEVLWKVAIPREYWETRDSQLLGGPDRVAEKRKGKWVVVERRENPEPEDLENTVLKMAQKRAKVASILEVTAAREMFEEEDGPRDTPPPDHGIPIDRRAMDYVRRFDEARSLEELEAVRLEWLEEPRRGEARRETRQRLMDRYEERKAAIEARTTEEVAP